MNRLNIKYLLQHYCSSVAQEKVDLFPSISKSFLFTVSCTNTATDIPVPVRGRLRASHCSVSFFDFRPVCIILRAVVADHWIFSLLADVRCVYCPTCDRRVTVRLDGFSIARKVWQTWMLSGGMTQNVTKFSVLTWVLYTHTHTHTHTHTQHFR